VSWSSTIFRDAAGCCHFSDPDLPFAEQIRKGAYEFHREQWKNISKEAVDLVRKMLVVDPRQRLTCEQVLQHPWLQGLAPDKELSATLEEIRRLNAKRRFKAAAMAVVWGAQLGLRRKLLTLVDSRGHSG
jgi:serine/threonine protein kinase